MDKSRQQFEQKIEHSYGEDYLVINNDGDYANWITADLWEFWQASREAFNVCPKCGGTGMADSGAVQPWCEPIEIECDCQFEGRENDTN